MPEYLAPGVFVEERPASLRAIEGVSTSTAAFVGPAERGPVAGYQLPFEPTNGFLLAADPVPTLVTSYADFVRQFGNPLRLPNDSDIQDRGYLGHAVRAFFDNGGRRLYITRVVAGSTRNTLRLGQGVILHLARRVRAGDTVLELNSLRGIDVNDTLTIRRRTDGSDALVIPAKPATLTGKLDAPFALSNGDTLSVQITGAGPPTTDTSNAVTATPAKITSAAGPFNISTTDTLEVRTGSPTAPIQTATFDTVTAGNATESEVALVLARDIIGASVEVDTVGNTVTLRSDVSGLDGYLEVVGGTAGGTLNFTPTPAGGNVANLAAVTVDELRNLFPLPTSFTLDATVGGKLLLRSNAKGAGVSIAVSGAIVALGLDGVTPVDGTGASSADPPVVESYDTRTGTVTLKEAVPITLETAEVYLEITAVDPKGPQVHARNPGGWSSAVHVNVIPADRAPVLIMTPASIGDTTIQVQSATSFYVGAIIEIDHDGQRRSAHEVMGIAGTTLTILPALDASVGEVPGRTSYARVLEIDVSIADASGAIPDELYRGLSWNPRQTEAILLRHYATQINARSRLVYVQPPGVGGLDGSEGPSFNEQPVTAGGFPNRLSDTAVDGIPEKGTSGDAVFVGDDLGPGRRTGIQAFVDIPEINIVAAPGRTGATVQLALITHCERMRYRFAVLDGEQDPGSVNSVQAHRNLYDSSYAGYYAPWIGQTIGGEVRYLPPSGCVAGIYARVDNQRGVWKAPANEVVRNAISLHTRYTTGEQEILNPRGVNLIRRFEPGGIRVWGARTLSSNPEVRYVNVRRTLLFIEASIERGTQWVVFEPNTPETWSRVAASVRSFLRTQWREGALFGRSEADAFFVRCDESTMTADDVLNGRLICRIGVAIVRPAEFVIFRIEQLTGFAES